MGKVAAASCRRVELRQRYVAARLNSAARCRRYLLFPIIEILAKCLLHFCPTIILLRREMDQERHVSSKIRASCKDFSPGRHLNTSFSASYVPRWRGCPRSGRGWTLRFRLWLRLCCAVSMCVHLWTPLSGFPSYPSGHDPPRTRRPS